MGAPIPWEDILEAAPLQGKRELLEKISQAQQGQQQQQAKIDELEEIEKRLQLSQIDENTSLSQERRARVLADIGLARERISEGEQNYAKAFLDNAKTVKEIQDMDRKRFLDVMELAAQIRMNEDRRTEQKLESDSQKAESLKQ